MYTIEIFLAILAIDGLLTLYAVLAKGSDYYKDIAAIIFAGFLSCYLALVCVSGTVVVYQVSDVLAIQTNETFPAGTHPNVVVEPSFNTTHYEYEYDVEHAMQDDGLMWIFLIIATIQGYFALLMSIEAYNDYVAGKADRENLI